MQVAFSAAALVLSGALAYLFANLVFTGSSPESPVVSVLLAGSVYFPFNSALVAIVLGLAEGQPRKQVCGRCYAWVFPYFMIGIAFAGLVSGVYTPSAIWRGALVLLPTMVLTCVYFLNRSARDLPTMMLPSSSQAEQEEYERFIALA